MIIQLLPLVCLMVSEIVFANGIGPAGLLSGVMNQAMSAGSSATSPTGVSTSSSPLPANSTAAITKPENALDAFAMADPKSMDAEIAVQGNSSSDSNGGNTAPPPDLALLWKCKRDVGAPRAICAQAIQIFCTGRCSRLNCMVPTNYVTCLDVCGEKASFIQPCLDAGKKNPGPAQIMNVPNAFDPYAPPPEEDDDASSDGTMAQGGGMSPPGMNPNAAMAMMGASAAANLAGSAVKGIGSMFGKRR